MLTEASSLSLFACGIALIPNIQISANAQNAELDRNRAKVLSRRGEVEASSPHSSRGGSQSGVIGQLGLFAIYAEHRTAFVFIVMLGLSLATVEGG
jgi:hypothetical protein